MGTNIQKTTEGEQHQSAVIESQGYKETFYIFLPHFVVAVQKRLEEMSLLSQIAITHP